MADTISQALQRALVAALKADAGVAALVGARVYDEPPDLPDASLFPYVRIADIDRQPLRTSGTPTASDFLVRIEAHSRPSRGAVQSRGIADAVVAALDDAALTVIGFDLRWIDFVATTDGRAPDGKSYVAIIVFQTTVDVPA